MESPATGRVIIVAEHTPNPDTVRLGVGRPIGPSPGVDFEDVEPAAAASPLAERLLRLPGVIRVHLGGDFVAVTRAPGHSWKSLGPHVQEALRDHLEADEPVLFPGWLPPPVSSDAADAEAEVKTIRRILYDEIRPAVQRDGGDVVFVAYAGGVLELELRGACVGCPSQSRTLEQGIATRLRRDVPTLVQVVSR
ncbi:MAG: NifU family protein [Myxococcota bacterium]